MRVLSYEDEAEGEMDGQRFVRVVLRPCVRFKGDVPAEHDRAHDACFIANAVNCEVSVQPPS